MKPFIFIALCQLPLLLNAQRPANVVEGNTRFAFSLFQALNTTSSNRFYSPFSISTALAMTYAGARNETALQMSRTLHFDPGDQFHQAFGQLLEKSAAGTGGAIRLNIANGMWAQKGYGFLDSYSDLVADRYRAGLNSADFTIEGEREKTRQEINEWVAQKTNDKIKGLLSKSDLDDLTRFVLVNAIWFYGDWEQPFTRESTMTKDFSLNDGSKVNVPFMNRHGRYRYFEDARLKAVEIPYKDNKASMIIFLPVKYEGIAEMAGALKFNYYQEITNLLQFTDLKLSVPKFKATSRFNLAQTLSDMGMPVAFSPGGADFSGMTGFRNLYISDVIHQAFINVDEKGTEAAAATAVVGRSMAAMPSPDVKYFIADHPFVFIIRDNATGSILFMGTVMNPAGL
jgi:serpin B